MVYCQCDFPFITLLQLQIGDQIVAVNDECVHGWTSALVADKMKMSPTDRVVLTVKAAAAAQHVVTEHLSVTGGGDSSAASTTSTRKKSSAASAQQAPAAANPMSADVEPGRVTLIEIDKGGHGLGLSIVGGSDTVLGTVVIHEVYADGAAAIDGRLKPGDQILEVNAQSLRNVTHETAINMLRHTPTHVRLLVQRDAAMQISLSDPTQIYNVIEVELTKKPGKGCVVHLCALLSISV